MKVSMDVNSYKGSFTGGARQYMFYVNMIFPGWGNAAKAGLQGAMAGGFDSFSSANLTETALTAGGSALSVLNTAGGMKGIEFYVKASTLPESNFEEIVTGWMGHDYKMSGKQNFNDWTVTYNVDKEGVLLRKFYDWQKMLHDPEANTYGKPVVYMTDPEIHLLGFDTGETVCCYKLYGAWPKSIGAVQLGYENDDLATVDITFAYQYHTVTESEPGVLSSLLKRGTRSFFQMGGMEAMQNLYKSPEVQNMMGSSSPSIFTKGAYPPSIVNQDLAPGTAVYQPTENVRLQDSIAANNVNRFETLSPTTPSGPGLGVNIDTVPTPQVPTSTKLINPDGTFTANNRFAIKGPTKQ